MKYKDILSAPDSYWTLDPKDKKKICNGVGPKGLDFLFPDTIWGLNINEAANIHDYMYHIGIKMEDKIKADEVFLNNMNTIIDAQNSWGWLVALRKRRALTYYQAVASFGAPAFFNKS